MVHLLVLVAALIVASLSLTREDLSKLRGRLVAFLHTLLLVLPDKGRKRGRERRYNCKYSSRRFPLFTFSPSPHQQTGCRTRLVPELDETVPGRSNELTLRVGKRKERSASTRRETATKHFVEKVTKE
jgi:hypothetical protein